MTRLISLVFPKQDYRQLKESLRLSPASIKKESSENILLIYQDLNDEEILTRLRKLKSSTSPASFSAICRRAENIIGSERWKYIKWNLAESDFAVF